LSRQPDLPIHIPGVEIRPLQVIADERGAVMHMLRADAPHFQRFGEIYFSVVHPGAVKAWRRHRSAVMNLAVPVGEAVVAIYDDRSDSPARGVAVEIPTGQSDYCLITIPAGVWSGFMAIGNAPAVIANCATEPHDPSEVDRRPAQDPAIPYIWGARGQV
jgi:dTDP-4-dehydrorhamnose 3,5-epimerase